MIIYQNEILNDRQGRIAHGFFGRQGGHSEGMYASLNCGPGSNDHPDKVQMNRGLAAQEIGLEASKLLSLNQVHSDKCVLVKEPYPIEERPKADALVTDIPGIGLGILTADCGPVLFSGEKENGDPVIGAAHAGWGGALKGIVSSTVQTMGECGAVPESLRAVIGPCIGPASYEVSAGFETPFLEQNPENEMFFKATRKEGHLMFDLPGYIASRLAEAGVRQVVISGIDTYAQEATCFSYRRATHRSEPDYGRQIAVIAIQH